MKFRTPEQVLERLRQLKEKLTPDLQKKVGNVFFGGDEKLAKAQGIKNIPPNGVVEPNTDWETGLYDRIQSWANRSDSEIAKYFKRNKALLDQLAKEFPELLQPPIGQMAYRGTAIKLDSLEQAFRKKKFEVIKLKGQEVFRFKNLDYSPKRDAQSWTVDPSVAFTFQGKGNPNTVSVVYATKVNKDFIFNPKLLDTIYSDEHETVRVAKEGTFEAFVNTSVIFNAWQLEPAENFIHRLPSAKPFFAKMIEKYNKIVDAENKQMGTNYARRANSVQDVIEFSDEISLSFDLRAEYTKYAQKYLNAIKKK